MIKIEIFRILFSKIKFVQVKLEYFNEETDMCLYRLVGGSRKPKQIQI